MREDAARDVPLRAVLRGAGHTVLLGVPHEMPRAVPRERQVVLQYAESAMAPRGLLGFKKHLKTGEVRPEAEGAEMTTITNYYGKDIPYAVAEQLFDRDLCEELHLKMAPCAEQEFFDAYCEEHERRFGEPFVLDAQNPQY